MTNDVRGDLLLLARNIAFLINTELKNLIIFADPVDNLHESIEDYSSTLAHLVLNLHKAKFYRN